MNQLSSMVVVCEFSPRWLLAWKLANRFGLSRFQKFLEDRPEFIASPRYRYATRSHKVKNGQIDFSLYSAPTSEPIGDCWPDVKA